MIIEKGYLLICLSVLLISNVAAQTNSETLIPEVNFPSPTAYEMAKFGSIPVDYHSGLANISVPLMKVTHKDISINLSLSYHSGGIKVNEVGGWAGLGWNMNSGGAISRSVNGIGDDVNSYGYAYNSDGIDTVSGTLPTYLESALKTGDVDTQPDQFSYSVNGKSGTFYLYELPTSSPPEIYTMPHSRMKFETVVGSVPHPDGGIAYDGIKEWTIIDENGYRYTFGGDDSFELSQRISATTIPKHIYYVSTWYLSKIESPNGNTITFNYSGFNLVQHQMGISKSKNYWVVGQCNVQENVLSSNVSTSKHWVKYLSSITAGDKEISFETDDRDDALYGSTKQEKLLDKITYKINSETLKIFDFEYGYYTTGGSTEFIKRLRLDGLTIQDKNLQYIEQYSFEYNSTTLLPRNSQALDHWGFQNNNSTNDILPSYNPSTQTLDASNRDPHSAKVYQGLLSEIVYPTGGRSTFEYESNEYRKSSVDYSGGGARIKKIKHYADGSANPASQQEFIYEDNSGNSYGVLLTEPKYLGAIDFNSDVGQCSYTEVSSSMLVPAALTSGSPVVYSTVKVRNSNSDDVSGYTLYNYEGSYASDQNLMTNFFASGISYGSMLIGVGKV